MVSSRLFNTAENNETFNLSGGDSSDNKTSKLKNAAFFCVFGILNVLFLPFVRLRLCGFISVTTSPILSASLFPFLPSYYLWCFKNKKERARKKNNVKCSSGVFLHCFGNVSSFCLSGNMIRFLPPTRYCMLGEGKSHQYKSLFVLSRGIKKKWYSLTTKKS